MKIFVLLLFLVFVSNCFGQVLTDFLKSGKTKDWKSDYQGAVTDFDKAIFLDSTLIEAYYCRGLSKFSLHDYNGAIIDFTKVICFNSNDIAAYFNRGKAKTELQDTVGAREDFLKTISINPKYISEFFEVGYKFNQLELCKKAIVYFDFVIEINPEYKNAYLERGYAKYETNDFIGAVSDLTEGYKLNPKNEVLFYYLCLSKLELKNPKSSFLGQGDTLSRKEQNRLVSIAQSESFNKLSIRQIENLINSNLITDGDLLLELRLSLCDDIFFKNKLSIYHEIEDTAAFHKNISEYLECFNEKSEKSDSNLYYYSLYIKHMFFKDLEIMNYLKDNELITIYKKNIAELKKVGFYPEVEGFGAGISLIKSNDIWIGAEFSVNDYHWFELSKIKTTCNGVTNTRWVSGEFFKMVKALTIGYNRALKSKFNDFSISLIDFCSPVYVAPLKFGMLQDNNLKQNNFYYSPMLGVGFGPISLIYTYKIYFTKEARVTLDKSFFIVKVSYAINDYWSNRRLRK